MTNYEKNIEILKTLDFHIPSFDIQFTLRNVGWEKRNSRKKMHFILTAAIDLMQLFSILTNVDLSYAFCGSFCTIL